MKIIRYAVTFSFLLVSYNNIFSQNTFEFLRMDMSPRAAALAGSFVSNADDPNVIFYNPAGLYSLEGLPVSFSYVNHLLDINLASLAVSKNFESIGKFGAAIQYINYGTFQGRDEFARETGSFGAGEVCFILGYSNDLDENFNYGVNAKFIYSGIESYYSTALAADVGLQYLIPDQLIVIGFSALNIGS